MQKQEIRRKIRQITKTKTDEEKTIESIKVSNALEENPAFQSANTILLFHSLPDEVNTHKIIEKYASKKRILLPAIIENAPYWEIREYTSPKDIKIGAYNIFEPIGRVFTDYIKIDLVIVPGMAFSPSGKRVGRGKGYYDRILSTINAPTLAVCFPWQILEDEEIECDEWDVKVNMEVVCGLYAGE